MIILVPISFGAYFAVVWWFFSHKADSQQGERVDEIWGRRQSWGEPLCRRLINREVGPEMTPEMVKLAWGEPTVIQSLPNGGEEWVYRTGGSRESIVTLQNSQVVRAEGNPPGADGKLNVWLIIAIVLGLAVLLCVITLIVIFAAR
jgi:hypothetical protein